MRKEYLLQIILIAFILGINLYFVWPFFQGENTQWLGSIESVFLAEAKFIVENFPRIFWYPFWYFGFPFYLAYQPLVPFTLAASHVLTGLSFSFLYRILEAFFYALGGVSIYFWVQFLTKKRLGGLVAALVYSFTPSIAYLFLPGWAEQGFIPSRLVAEVVYGEGPHIWGLALVPLVLIYFQRMLKEPGKRANWFWAISLVSGILLISLTAFVGLLVFLLVVFLTEIVLGGSRTKTLIVFIFALGVLGTCLFWYNPSFLKAALLYSLGEGGGILTGFYRNPVFLFLLGLPVIFGTYTLSQRFLNKHQERESFFLTGLIFALLLLTIWFWFAFSMALLPLPFRTIPRLIPELELAWAALLGVISVFIFEKLKNLKKFLGWLFAGGILLTLFLIAAVNLESMRKVTLPHQEVTTSSEFQISSWLAEEVGGSRIYATGTHAFWLNVWTNVSQLRGGKGGDFGGLNPWWAHVNYQLYSGIDGELAVDWLKALGIRYVVVNLPNSKVIYKDFDYPEKFEKILTKVYDYQGDVIYQVPLRHPSLVLAIEGKGLDQVRGIEDLTSGKIVLDREWLASYLRATEKGEKTRNLSFSYPAGSWNKLEVNLADLGPNEEVLIRISYHPGWRGFQNKTKVRIEKDPLGFMRLKVKQGENLRLEFRPTLDVYLSFFFSGIAIVLLGIFIGRGLLPERLEKSLKAELKEKNDKDEHEE